MKTVLIAAALVATSFVTMAETNNYPPQITASGPSKTRAEVIAEFNVAKAAGLIQITESEIRQAESLRLQSQSSTVTREQVKQEVVAMRQRGFLEIQGDHR